MSNDTSTILGRIFNEENAFVLFIYDFVHKEFGLIVYLLAGFTYEEKVFKILQCTKSDNINAL